MKNPDCWEIKQGSILDIQFVNTLEPADIVYAWGVLHHTGDMWKAIENTASLVKKDGLFYLALYTPGIMAPSDDFWLDVKQRYNLAGWLTKRKTELWYVWRFLLRKNLEKHPTSSNCIFIIKRNAEWPYIQI